MTTFYHYVLSLRGLDSPAGDFADDFVDDVRRRPSLKRRLNSWYMLESYLKRRYACREAILAARDVWECYRRLTGA